MKDLCDFDAVYLLQILPEHLLDFSKYNNVFIIDADETVEKGEVFLKDISEINGEVSFYHGIGIRELYEVGLKTGYVKGKWYIIAIGGGNFQFNEEISVELMENFNEIVSKVIEICKSLS